MSRHDEHGAGRALVRGSVGEVLDGTVATILPFGAVVDLGDGIRGLVHGSEWVEAPPAGTPVRVEILAIDIERQRMSLRPLAAG
jgi:small subunit ribosomal protein S1